jgi:DNA polymerase-4
VSRIVVRVSEAKWLHCYAHIDMDAFYVSVELMRRPELRGKPVVVAGSGPRAVVTTASYEARQFGIHSATPASRARRLCPDAIFIPPDFDTYRKVSKRVMERVQSYVERVEIVGLDEAYLDLTGLVAPRAAMRRLVSETRAATGIGCSVGIGPNKLVAKVASDAEKPGGFVVLTREEASVRFAEAPPRLLPGIGAKTAERLERLGIATLGALARSTDEDLAEHFGQRWGPYLRRRASFEDDGDVETDRVAVSESRETTFDYDIADRAEQAAVLRRLSDELCAGLRKSARRGRTIAIKVRLDDFTTVTRARTITRATDDPAVVGELACTLLEEYAPPRPVRLLGVRVASFDSEEPAPAEDQSQLALPL